MVCMRQRHSLQVSHRDVDLTTYKMLLLLYCILTSYLSQSGLYGADFQILHCSGAFGRRQKTFKPENTFKQTHVNFFTAKI